MVEIEVSGLEHSHDLNALCWFTVEGDRGGLYHLSHKSLQGDDIHLQHTAIHQIRQTVQHRIDPEQTLCRQLILRTGILRHMTDDSQQGV